jgi:hypothetical protein
LCLGFEQITMTRPRRWTILHFSHIFLTDGRTFNEARSQGIPSQHEQAPRQGAEERL